MSGGMKEGGIVNFIDLSSLFLPSCHILRKSWHRDSRTRAVLMLLNATRTQHFIYENILAEYRQERFTVR